MPFEYWGGAVYSWSDDSDYRINTREIILRVPLLVTCQRCELTGYFTYSEKEDHWVCPRCSATKSNLWMYVETRIRNEE